MKFKCNNMTYEIVEVEEDDLKEEYIKEHPNEKKEDIFLYGRTSFTQHIIKLCKDLNEEEKIRTLKHELTHCWMWNTANCNQENYNEEHICEIVACSNDFINEIVNQYLGIEPLYLCDKGKNTECCKNNCGICTMTDNIKYAQRRLDKEH